MSNSIEKSQLRQHLRTLRNALTTKQKFNFDHSIRQQLHHLIQRENYQTIHTYLPVRTEIDLLPLIEQLLQANRTVICPKTLKNRQLEHLVLTDLNDLETGLYQTQHPANGEIYQGEYDLIIVPGLAFDRAGYRLGYGGGYYDTFLEQHPRALKVGAGYPFQLIESVPREAHDVQLDRVIIGS